MSELLLFSPILIALPPGLWSFGHMKRMFLTLTALLLGPVLVAVPGVMMLGRFGLTWRSVVWRWCGLCFLAGIVELVVWGVGYLWQEVPAGRWHWLVVWLSRGAILAVIGGMCAGFTVFSSLIVLFCADSDYNGELDGEKVVVQYLLDEGCNYYAYHGPLLRGTELLEGSAVLEQHRKEANEYRNQNHHHVFFLGLADRYIHRSDHVCEIHEGGGCSMKAIKYWLQYLAVVSLFLLMVSGIYDIAAEIKALNWYLHWHREQYGPIPLPSAIFTYALGLFRGTAAVFGCGLVGLMQVSKRRIRGSYMLFLAFWTAEYTLAVVSKAYKGIQPDDAIQMLTALFCFTAMAIQYFIHFKRRRV